MEPTQKSNGALIGSTIIIIILILGGIYFWRTNLKNLKENEAPNTETTDSVGATSTTDLEANINSIDLEGLDEGL